MQPADSSSAERYFIATMLIPPTLISSRARYRGRAHKVYGVLAGNLRNFPGSFAYPSGLARTHSASCHSDDLEGRAIVPCGCRGVIQISSGLRCAFLARNKLDQSIHFRRKAKTTCGSELAQAVVAAGASSALETIAVSIERLYGSSPM